MNIIKKSALLFTTLGIAFACSTDGDDGDSDSSQSGGTGPGAGGLDGATGGAASGGIGSGGTNTGGVDSSTGGDEATGGMEPGFGGEGGMGGANGLPSGIKFSFDPRKDQEAEVCAAKQLEATEVLLDMFIILDKSGSMDNTISSGPICFMGPTFEGSRWCNAITALDGFFADSSSVGMGVAYSEFASTGCPAFAQLDVPFNVIEAGDANGHLLALNTALGDNDAGGGTQTEGAVNTLIAETAAHVPGPNRKAIAILITDGLPGSCLGSASC